MFRIRFLALLIASALALAAQSDKKKNPAIGNPEAIEAGRKIFSTGCAGCHGQNGQGGRGPNLKGRGMWHSLDDDGLFNIVKKGVPGADMPPSNRSDEELWQIIAFVRSMTAPAIDQNVAGNADAGSAIFWGKGGCSNCHQIRGRGGLAGPDLSNLGGTHNTDDMREAISDPDADWNEAYRKVTLVMRNGSTMDAILRNRDNYSMQVQDSAGKLHLVPINDIKEYTLKRRSPMPKAKLDKQEMDDLIAYLSRQSMRPRDTESEKGKN